MCAKPSNDGRTRLNSIWIAGGATPADPRLCCKGFLDEELLTDWGSIDGLLNRRRAIHRGTNHEIIIEPVDGAKPYSWAVTSFVSAVDSATSSVFLPPIIGARMRMPFSPRFTKRPSEFHVRIPATLVACGFASWTQLSHCTETCNMLNIARQRATYFSR
jgi:hypothetical protein